MTPEPRATIELYGVTLTNPADKVCATCGRVIHPEDNHAVNLATNATYCYPCYIQKGTVTDD